ncbi:MAG: peptidylprolyl isomerase [Patescibacteria group bacterium]
MQLKYILLSIVVVALVAWGGYALFGKKTSFVLTNNESTSGLDGYATTTDSAQTPGSLATTTTNNSTSNTTTHNTKSHMITINTNYGDITIETYDADAPNTVENFVTLASKGFYNGLTFHRVIKGFMIQGGDPSGNGTGGPGYKFADELNPETASYKAGYKKGVVAMANAGPNTNGSQFFIMTADYPLPNAYTIFGHVVSGQDVVDTIANVKTGANDKPVSPVVMKTVSVK